MTTNKFFTIVCAAAMLSFFVSISANSNSALAQGRKNKDRKENPEMQNGQKPDDQGDKAGAEKDKKKGPMAMDKFLTPDTKVMKGFTTVYEQKDDKWCININDSVIGRDIQIVSRIVKSAEGGRISFGGYAGDEINDAMIRFSKGPGNKIFIQEVLLRERSTGELAQNVKNSNVNAIIASFDIKAQGNGDNVIDITDFLLSDNNGMYFTKGDKKGLKINGIMKDRSYVESIKTYPINTEFTSLVTYGKEEGSATYVLNISMVMLPKVPMQPRYEDPRVGYFTVGYTDFDKNPQGVKRVNMISRWRLEPKPEDAEKYAKGELVEPAKPIVIYIDPSTPKEWVPYLIAGVNDWQPAFEAAGFKNAIHAEVAPTKEQDSTWSLEDATHSAIIYKPSDIENASGPHVSDPRSGEIIETHINWYHNVMKLLRDWYMIQCAPSDTMARHMVLPTNLMGELIRFVSSHEVGHTLGLRHNFIGSAHYTLAQLKDVNFLKEYGHASSIMDYARFNYVAEPGDNIPQNLMFPCIGPYDKWAIQWGYKRLPQFTTPDSEIPYLSNVVKEKIKNPIYQFGTESSANDPRLQSEDLGANQMETNEVGTRNLKFIMNHLIEWTNTPNEGYDNLLELYDQVIGQYRRYNNHVAKWIGGVYEDEKYSDQPGAIYTHVEKAKQKEAMAYLKRNTFSPQMWLVPNDVMNKIIRRPDIVLEQIYNSTLDNLVSRRVLLNCYEDEISNGAKAYSLSDYFADMNSMIFAPDVAGTKEASAQRIMQKAYVKHLIDLYTGANAMTFRIGDRTISTGQAADKDNSDIGSMIYYQLTQLQQKFLAASATGTPIRKAHYKFMYDKIHKTLTEQKVKTEAAPQVISF